MNSPASRSIIFLTGTLNYDETKIIHIFSFFLFLRSSHIIIHFWSYRPFICVLSLCWFCFFV